jgi:hypothetical protein
MTKNFPILEAHQAQLDLLPVSRQCNSSDVLISFSAAKPL